MTDPSRSSAGDRYAAFLDVLKDRIRAARLRASVSVNQELILLYWSIGRDILERQAAEGWGARIIDRLARDLRRDFPESTGFSARNLKYMRAFAEAYTDRNFVQQVVAQLPWGHNVRLIDAVKQPVEREWYARQAIEHGWSRAVFIHQIDSHLYQRQGKALTNFARALPEPQSELAQQIIKDPYNFDFLALGPAMTAGRPEKARKRECGLTRMAGTTAPSTVMARSEATKQSLARGASARHAGDCRVASLLAMTGGSSTNAC